MSSHPSETETTLLAPGELAVVCSHYSLGEVASVTPLPRGGAATPKAVLRTSSGAQYFVKRREEEEGGARIAVSHALHAHLASRSFPVPPLLRTTRSGATYIRTGGQVYELYEFLSGETFDGSLSKIRASGEALARFHALAADFPGAGALPEAGFHGDSSVAARLGELRRGDGRGDPRVRVEAERLLNLLEWAGGAAGRAGPAEWARGVIHADWHPGNLIFRLDRVVAVLDLDTARIGPRVADLALASLHFSTVPGHPDPGRWPASADLDRIAALFAGYHAREGVALGRVELAALPALMVEALTAQVVTAVSSSGRFGNWAAHSALEMAVRKASWFKANAGLILEAAE